jgi:hypothetical protein
MPRVISRAILVLGRSEPAEETLRQVELFDEVFVVECAAPAAEDEYVVDEERARREARERLRAVLDRLHRDGVSAEGAVGDPSEEAAARDAEAVFPDAGIILYGDRRPGH